MMANMPRLESVPTNPSERRVLFHAAIEPGQPTTHASGRGFSCPMQAMHANTLVCSAHAPIVACARLMCISGASSDAFRSTELLVETSTENPSKKSK